MNTGKIQNAPENETEKLAKARLAAQVKRAVDYQLPEDDNRSISEVEADLAQLRLELAATVDDLVHNLDPEVIKAQVKVKAKHSFNNLQEKAKNFAKDLLNGDPKALKTAGIALAGVGALLLLRKIGK